MFKDDSNAMHVQPSLPEGSVHGKDGLPVRSKLGLRGVFGSTVLQGQNLDKKKNGKTMHTTSQRQFCLYNLAE